MTFLPCTGALKAVEVASPLIPTELSTTTTEGLVRLRICASVRTNQAKMNQGMRAALANRPSVTLNVGMENAWRKYKMKIEYLM
jgi:hypothetical protein